MNLRHVKEQPNPDDRLLEKILSRDNLIAAWKRVKANGGAPGIECLTIEEFPAATRCHWHEILESLMTGTYQPSPVRRMEVQNRREVFARLESPVFWTA